MEKRLKCIERCAHKIVKRLSRRVLALFLVCAMLVGEMPLVYADEGVATEINVAEYTTSSLRIYDSINYDAADGKKQPNGGNGFILKGEKTTPFEVIIGTEDNSVNDIEVALKGLTLSDDDGKITVYEVYENNEYIAVLSVTEASKVTTVELKKNAVLDLKVQANLELENLYLNEGSKLILSVEEGAVCKISNLINMECVPEGTYTLLEDEEDHLVIQEITEAPTEAPTTVEPTEVPTTEATTEAPTTVESTEVPATEAPAEVPTTVESTEALTTEATTEASTTVESTEAAPTEAPTEIPTAAEESSIAAAEENIVNEPAAASLELEEVTTAESTEAETAAAQEENEIQETEAEETEEVQIAAREIIWRTSSLDTTKEAAEVVINAGKGTLALGTVILNSLEANGAVITLENSLTCKNTLTLNETDFGGVVGENEVSVIAEGDISVTQGTIHDFALFGYDANAQGEKAITFSGNTRVSDIEVLGVMKNAQAIVNIVGLSSISSVTRSNVYSDFPVTFYHQTEVKDMGMTHYRASYTNQYGTADIVILGTHNNEEGYRTDDTALPIFTLGGYAFDGWLLNNEGEPISDLSDNLEKVEALSLYTKIRANAVTATWDLDFDLTAETTDMTGNRTWTESYVVGETVTIDSFPTRMGYEFDGWEIAGSKETIANDATSYTVEYEDLNEDGTLTLTAQWHERTYEFRLSFNNSEVDPQYIEISFDNGTSWHSVTSLDLAGMQYHESGNYISFTNEILYGTPMVGFFKGNNYQFPILRDTRDNAVKKAFSGWTTLNATAVTSESQFCYGSGGILDGRTQGQTLADYDNNLKLSPFVIQPNWGTVVFELNVPTVSNWTYLIDGVEKTPVNGVISVLAGAIVTFRTPYSNASTVSQWSVQDDSAHVYLTEQTYQAGNPYLNYTFTMPTSDVTAEYGQSENYYFSLYHGSITFAESVLFNGLARDGFWYPYLVEEYTPLFAKVGDSYKKLSELEGATPDTYFYTWTAKEFYVCSTNKEDANEPVMATTNQLTLLNEKKVYLKDCNLTATSDYKEKAIGRTLNGKALQHQSPSNVKQSAMGQYGNIVIDNGTHATYSTYLYIEGENTINAIFQSSLEADSSYKGNIYITGKDNKTDHLYLGSVMGNYTSVVENLTISEIADDTYAYLFYTANSTLQGTLLEFTNVVMKAQHKELHNYYGNIHFYGTSNIHIGDIMLGYWIETKGTTYLRIHGNVYDLHFAFKLSDDSSVVVDGIVMVQSEQQTNGTTMNTTGYFVSKGVLCNVSSLNMYKGTLIANTVVTHNSINMTGGTIITNQIIDSPGYKQYLSDSIGTLKFGTYNNKGSYDTARTENSDLIPFKTYRTSWSASTRSYLFNGGEVLLFGYYETNDDNTYKFHEAWSSDNPMSALINGVLDENGDLKSELTIKTEDVKTKIATQAEIYKAKGTMPECIVFGNSSEDTGNPDATTNQYNTVSGTAFYAAGNMTFFNRTELQSGAKMTVYGALRSNRDLIIQKGAEVTAAQISNAWDLSSRLNDGTYRWQEVIINGGTIQTDLLGDNDEIARTTLRVTGTPVITGWKKTQVDICQDVRINYVYNDEFLVTSGGIALTQNYDNLRTFGIWNSALSSMSTDARRFADIKTIDNQKAEWVLGSLNGETVSAVDAVGELDDTAKTKGYECENISLYAKKESYVLTVKAGLENLVSIKQNGEAVTTAENMQLKQGAEIVLTVPAAMLYKTVIWYTDSNGILHNVIPTADAETNTVRFIMPAANAELYITDEITLDLAKYPISLIEDGFIVEETTPSTLDSVREDAVFVYYGNILIKQSDITKIVVNSSQFLVNASSSQLRLTGNSTKNRILFVSDPTAFTRTVTLEKVYQQCGKNVFGIYAYNGATVDLIVSGAVRIESIGIESDSVSIKIQGKQNNGFNKNTRKTDIQPTADALFMTSYARQYGSGCIMTSSQKIGTIEISNIILLKDYSARFIRATQQSGSVVINDVYSFMSTYEEDLFGQFIAELSINNSAFEMVTLTSNSDGFIQETKEFVLNNSYLSFLSGGTVKPGYAVLGKMDTLKLIDSEVKLDRRNSASGSNYREHQVTSGTSPKSVIMEGHSKLTSSNRLQLLSLQMSDESVVEVVKGTGYSLDSYFLCKDVLMKDNSKITADQVIISGFIEGIDLNYSSVNDFNKWVANKQYLISTGKLEMQGGEIIAAKSLGGSGAVLNISGGTVTSPIIGSIATIYGFTQMTHTINESAVHEASILPSAVSSTVNISGGTINVTEGGYLGGYNSKVTILGGKVNLGSSAVLGLTEEQLTEAVNEATANGKNPANEIKNTFSMTGGKVEGEAASILIPYGSVDISGTASAVKVQNLCADLGNITIKNAAGAYANPNGTSDPKVGIYVSETMSAQQVDISEQAMVYANHAEALIPAGTTGYLKISSTNSDTRLYVNNYGVYGDGATEESAQVNPSSEGGNRNIFYIGRIVPIRYHLLDDSLDSASNDETNPTTYNQYQEEEIILKAPVRRGYDFGGWFVDSTCTGTPITEIDTTNSNPVDLYAKWTPKQIPVIIVIDSNKLKIEGFEDEVAGRGSLNEDKSVFTYSKTFEVSYRTAIQGQGINMSELDLLTYAVEGLVVATEGYTGNTYIGSGTILGPEHLAAYEQSADKTLRLQVSAVYKKRQEITFDLNIKAGLPYESSFNVALNATDSSNDHSRTSLVNYDQPLSTGKGLGSGDDFIRAQAEGYEFMGWSSNPEAVNGTKDLSSVILKRDTPTKYYAVWKAKTYTVTFTAEGGAITEGTEPTEADTATYNRTVAYDQTIAGSEGLPVAWKDGFVFVGWESKENQISLTDSKILRTRTFSEMEVDAAETETALTFEAKFRKVEVTYHLQGGKWTQETYANTDTPVWGEALRGYMSNAVGGDGYTILSQQGSYGIISTTANYYSTNGKYAEGDYREDIIRKGYTFRGWYETAEAAETASALHSAAFEGAVVTTPQYKDAELYAAWQPNTYHINLNALDTGMEYKYTNFEYQYQSDGSVPNVTLTVGMEIKSDTETANEEDVEISEWPERNTWYAHDKGDSEILESEKRYLLGFTFAPLDPGSREGEGKSIYQIYAAYVTSLINDDLLMREGESTFFIPEVFNYGDVNGHSANVPDYPTDSEIDMYAVYRERSLVFVEYYKNGEEIHETEKEAVPYQEWSAYPYEEYEVPQELTDNGYVLLDDWYFLHPTVDPARIYPHTKASYNAEIWAGMASEAGVYDIYVYTVYAAQETFDETLNGDGNAVNPNRVAYIDHVIPSSMQTGAMKYEVINTNGLNLVSLNILNEKLYSTSIGENQTSNDTVAIKWYLIDKDDKVQESGDLSSGTVNMGTVAASSGWKIRLELYTSNVITQTNSYNLEIKFGFQAETLNNQWMLANPLTVNLIPTVYRVVYDANLPKNPNLTITSYNKYNVDGKLTILTNYGGKVTDLIPEVEGYTVSNVWTQTDVNGTPVQGAVTRNFGGILDVAVSAADNGELYFKTDWTINTYLLSVSADVMQYWDVKYTTLDGTTETFTDTDAVDVQIPYHSTVVFTAKSGQNDPPEFVKIVKCGEESTLNQHDDYTLTMGAGSLIATRERVRTLYLEPGTIDITEDGYTQNGEFVTWHGDYVIWMDEENNIDNSDTENVLNLSGNLSDRQISLGDLYITSPDSISLAKDTTAALTAYSNGKESTIQAKNIEVSEGANLMMTQGSLVLTPDSTHVAAGGSDLTSKLTLKQVDITMTLPEASKASGIAAGTLELTGCTVTGIQKASVNGHYEGTWIGGSNTQSVVLNQTTVLEGTGSENYTDSYVIYADTVTLNNTTVGTQENEVHAPIYATGVLDLNNSSIYQEINGKIVATPVGAGTSIQVSQGSQIYTVKENGSWNGDKEGILYSGKMLIEDVDSEVIIDNTLILELENGSVTINDGTTTQASKTHTFNGNFLLLEERMNTGGTADVTVNRTASVTVQAPNENTDFRLNELKVNAETSLKLMNGTDLSVTTLDINHSKLNAFVPTDNSIELKANAVQGAEGIYEQTGGNLISDSLIQGDQLDIILNGVTVNAGSLIAKNLTLTDSTVTCTNGEVGSKCVNESVTKVILSGNTTVTAKTVGALGAQHETFTFVTVDGAEVNVNGNLVEDHYRIRYELNTELYTAPNYTVFRTTQTNAAGEKTSTDTVIPPEPTLNNLDSFNDFNLWYYTDTEKKNIALAEEGTDCTGFAGKDILRADLSQAIMEDTNPSDGTKTLVLNFGMKVTGTAKIKVGRWFIDKEFTLTEVTLPANAAWTTLFTVEGGGLDAQYELNFGSALPEGTKLTLTVFGSDTPVYYYYIVGTGGVKTLNFNEFTAMGGTTAFQSPASAENEYSFKMLLAADFEDSKAAAVTKNKVSLNFVSEDYPKELASVAYTLQTVDGGVAADTSKVTVTRPTTSVYAGKDLALIAEVTDTNGNPVSLSYHASITLGTEEGQVFDGNKMAFMLDDTTNTFDYTVSGIYGSYQITWKLAVRESTNLNLNGDVIASAASVRFSDVAAPTEPYLSATVTSIDNGTLSAKGRTLPQGEAHTLVLAYETNAASVTVEGQKQNEILCTFDTDARINVETVQPQEGKGTITLTLPASLEAGVYRICISIKDGCTDDDVYLSYVVMP